jgi:hypothetical protein
MIAAQQPLTPQEKLEVERVRKLLLEPGAPAADGAHFVPLSPQSSENGTKFDAEHGEEHAQPLVESATESEASLALATSGLHDPSAAEYRKNGRISYRAAEVAGTQLATYGEASLKDGTGVETRYSSPIPMRAGGRARRSRVLRSTPTPNWPNSPIRPVATWRSRLGGRDWAVAAHGAGGELLHSTFSAGRTARRGLLDWRRWPSNCRGRRLDIRCISAGRRRP